MNVDVKGGGIHALLAVLAAEVLPRGGRTGDDRGVMMRRRPAAILGLVLVACGAPSPPPAYRSSGAEGPLRGPSAGASAARVAARAPSASSGSVAPAASGSAGAAASSAAPTGAVASAKPGETKAEAAERVLFLATHLRTDEIRKVCPATAEEEARVRCLLSLRYADDAEARELAFTLYTETGSLAGLLPAETTEDGRGNKVRLLPARPVGPNRQHLTWIIAAFRAYRGFRAGLSSRAPISFRDRPVDLRFFYSETGGMPSAFAATRNIGYNLYGALNVSEITVRDTLFHELFHLNDGWRGGWSKRALVGLYDGIVARCGKRRACLSPYAPTDTMISGQYYAFMPKGGVTEYAAELALRYFREHSLVFEGKPLPVEPFKCGPAENASAWRLMADEFFGGVDRVPGCGT